MTCRRTRSQLLNDALASDLSDPDPQNSRLDRPACMQRLASELPRGLAGSVSASRPASLPEKGRRTRSQDRNAHRIVAQHRSVSSESKLTSVVRIKPRVVPSLCGGHTMNRDDRPGGRSANRATPAPLPPGSEVRMPQTVAVASGRQGPFRPPLPGCLPSPYRGTRTSAECR